jgi:putative membrane protein
MRASFSLVSALLLAVVWLGPLPALARQSFAAHMTMHMAVVVAAAPLMAFAVAGSRYDPIGRRVWFAAPLAASMIEMAIVWGWHAPALHHAARHHMWALATEQGSFLAAGVLLWMTAFAGSDQRPARAASGVVALLFTSMHMTLLGALFTLANRPLFQHGADTSNATAVADQQLGGAIMLIAGGASYLIGGLWLTGRVLQLNRPALTLGHTPDRADLSTGSGAPRPFDRYSVAPSLRQALRRPEPSTGSAAPRPFDRFRVAPSNVEGRATSSDEERRGTSGVEGRAASTDEQRRGAGSVDERAASRGEQRRGENALERIERVGTVDRGESFP